MELNLRPNFLLRQKSRELSNITSKKSREILLNYREQIAVFLLVLMRWSNKSHRDSGDKNWIYLYKSKSKGQKPDSSY